MLLMKSSIESMIFALWASFSQLGLRTEVSFFAQKGEAPHIVTAQVKEG